MRTYACYRDLFENHALPLAYVDLDLFDENLSNLAAASGDASLRVVSSMLRCVPLIERALRYGPPFRGLFSATVAEAVFLSQQGLDNILVGRPIWREEDFYDLAEELRRGKSLVCLVDSLDSVDRLNGFGEAYDVLVPVCMAADLSPGGTGPRPDMHGVIGDGESAIPVAVRIRDMNHVSLEGILIRSAPMCSPGQTPGGWLSRIFGRSPKRRARQLAARRDRLVRAVVDATHEVSFVNCGSGNFETPPDCEGRIAEHSLGTELLAPQGPSNAEAAIWGVAVEMGHLSSQGPAAGTASPMEMAFGNALDVPWTQDAAGHQAWEGGIAIAAASPPSSIRQGDPTFLSPAHPALALELFETVLLVAGGKVVDEVPTYRGEGRCFL